MNKLLVTATGAMRVNYIDWRCSTFWGFLLLDAIVSLSVAKHGALTLLLVDQTTSIHAHLLLAFNA